VNVVLSVMPMVLNYINVKFTTLQFHFFHCKYTVDSFNFWKIIRNIKMYKDVFIVYLYMM
jgi:hypothetical protein